MLTQSNAIADGTILQFGTHQFTFGQEVVELKNSNALLGDVPALQQQMAEDGYLFFRSFFKRETVLQARHLVLSYLASKGYLKSGSEIDEGLIGEENKRLALFRMLEVAHSPEVLAVVNSPEIMSFFEAFLGGEVLTFDKRWLRAISKGGSNHWHYDSIFMARGTPRLYTCWTPIGDIPLEQGGLILSLGSHKHEQLKATYGSMDTDRDIFEPNFTSDPTELVEKFGFTLATTNYLAGDLLIFGMHTMHASIPNSTDKYRISIDTRYQLASEPVDERFMGKDGTWKGNYNFWVEPKTPIKELRAKWGL